MLGKILLTAAIVLAGLAFVRFRQQRLKPVVNERVINPPVTKSRRFSAGWLASAAVVFMLLASGLLLYSYWQDRNQIIQVRVVDAASGKQTLYRALRGDVDDRAFLTVDGVHVVLAETERLETQVMSRDRN